MEKADRFKPMEKFAWLAAITAAIVCLYYAYAKFVALNPYLDDAVSAQLYSQARRLELLGRVLLICGPLLCGLIGAWKHEQTRRIFPTVYLCLIIIPQFFLFK